MDILRTKNCCESIDWILIETFCTATGVTHFVRWGSATLNVGFIPIFVAQFHLDIDGTWDHQQTSTTCCWEREVPAIVLRLCIDVAELR
jgi:hypothetical protein